MLDTLNLGASGGVSQALFAFLNTEENNVMATLSHLQNQQHFSDLARIIEPLLWHFSVQGRFADGIRVCKEIIARWPQQNEDGFEALAAVLNSYAWLNYYAGNLDIGYTTCRRALSLAEHSGSELQMLRALGHLAGICNFRGEYLEALEWLARAEPLAQNNPDPMRQIRIWTTLSGTRAMGYDPEQALKPLERVRNLLQQGQIPLGMDTATFYTVVAWAHLMRNEYAEGLDAAWTGIEVAQTIGSSGHQAGLYGLIAVLTAFNMEETPNETDALALEQWIQHFLPQVRQTRSLFDHTLFHLAAARFAFFQNQTWVALRYIIESLNLTLQTGALGLFSWLLPSLAEYYMRCFQPNAAFEVLDFLINVPYSGSWISRQAVWMRDRIMAQNPYPLSKIDPDFKRKRKSNASQVMEHLSISLSLFKSLNPQLDLPKVFFFPRNESDSATSLSKN